MNDNKDNNDLKLPRAEPATTSYEARVNSMEGARFAIHVEQDPNSEYSGEFLANNLIQGFANPDKVGGTGIQAQAGTYDEGGAEKSVSHVFIYIDGLKRTYTLNGEDRRAFRLSEIKQIAPQIVKDYIEMAKENDFKPALVYPEDYKPTPMPE